MGDELKSVAGLDPEGNIRPIFIKRYFGGSRRGRCFQLTGASGFLNLTSEQATALAIAPIESVANIRVEHGEPATPEGERDLITHYLRHMATLRPNDAQALKFIASDIEAAMHHDHELNPMEVDEYE